MPSGNGVQDHPHGYLDPVGGPAATTAVASVQGSLIVPGPQRTLPQYTTVGTLAAGTYAVRLVAGRGDGMPDSVLSQTLSTGLTVVVAPVGPG